MIISIINNNFFQACLVDAIDSTQSFPYAATDWIRNLSINQILVDTLDQTIQQKTKSKQSMTVTTVFEVYSL